MSRRVLSEEQKAERKEKRDILKGRKQQYALDIFDAIKSDTVEFTDKEVSSMAMLSSGVLHKLRQAIYDVKGKAPPARAALLKPKVQRKPRAARTVSEYISDHGGAGYKTKKGGVTYCMPHTTNGARKQNRCKYTSDPTKSDTEACRFNAKTFRCGVKPGPVDGTL